MIRQYSSILIFSLFSLTLFFACAPPAEEKVSSPANPTAQTKTPPTPTALPTAPPTALPTPTTAAEVTPKATDATSPAVALPVATPYDTPHAPPVLKVPGGAAPEGGWPMLLLLHGYRSNEQDFVPVAKLAASLGVAAIAVPAIMEHSDAKRRRYAWPKDDPARTHAYLQGILSKYSGDVRFDTKQVYLGGFSQGGLHSTLLLLEHPEQYLGVLAISPAGWATLPKTPPHPIKRPLFLIGGEAEKTRYQNFFSQVQTLWSDAKAPLQHMKHPGGHQFPPNSQQVFRDALLWLQTQQ